MVDPTQSAAAQKLIGKAFDAERFRSQHPHNLGHQVGPVLPAVALMDLVGSLLDTGNGVYEVGNPATPMERVVLKDLAARLGFSTEADGILTSGGSLGNLTALLAMRQARTDSWDQEKSTSSRWRKTVATTCAAR